MSTLSTVAYSFLSFALLHSVTASLDLNVFIYDHTQEISDQSMEILNNCSCSNESIVSSFSDGWDYAYDQSQQLSEQSYNESFSAINFYFLSNLILTNADINKYMTDIPTSVLNLECAKPFEIFTFENNECILTFTNDSIQLSTDALLLADIDNTTIASLMPTLVSVNGLIIHSFPSLTSQGLLLQTVNGDYDHSLAFIDLIFENIISNGAPLFSATHFIHSLAMYNCAFYDMSQRIFTVDNIANIDINGLEITNIITNALSITHSESLWLTNIAITDCISSQSCVSITDTNHSLIDTFTCDKCERTAIYVSDCDSFQASNLQISNGNYGLQIYDISNYVSVMNGAFQSNTASAIAMDGVAFGTIEHCNFTNNSDMGSGGALSLNNGNNDYYIVNECIFSGNSAEKFAGAVMIQYCRVEIKNCEFIKNEADIGGAVAYLDWASQFPLFIQNCSFHSNIAYSSGGALYVFSGEYILDGIQCIDNQAKISGGCLHDANGFLDCNDANPVRTRIQWSQFYGNKARQAAVGYLTSCFLSMEHSEVINNTAYIQGGGFVIDSTVIDGRDSSDNSTQYRVSNVEFRNNFGGLSGGALILIGGDILIGDNTQFSDNSAGSKGGAILIQGIDEWSVNTNIENTQFINNNAENGGAILMETIQLSNNEMSHNNNSNNLALNECDLHSNDGTLGGAMYISNGNVWTNDCLLSENTANNGGALYFENGEMSDYNSIFENNLAESKGGAVYIGSNNNIVFEHSVFDTNEADLYGGAVYFSEARISDATKQCLLTAEMSQSVAMNNNTATLSGGGYFFEVNDDLQSTFAESDCNVTNDACQWCADCTILHNFVGGSDGGMSANNFGTKAYKMNVEWSVDSGATIDSLTEIQIKVEIRDFVCDLVTEFSDSDVTLIGNVSTANNDKYALVLEGSSLQTFKDGRSDLSFNVIPLSNAVAFIQKNIIFESTLSVSVSLNENAHFSEELTVFYSNKLYELPSYVIVFGVLLGALSLLTVFVTIYLTKHYGTEKIITGSNVYFLFIILFGIVLASISMILVPFTPFAIDCRVLLWFVHLAFVLTVCPLAGKTWRIWLFFHYYSNPQKNSENKKDFKWTTLRLANVFVALPLAIVTVYLLIWSLAMPWTMQYSFFEESDSIYVLKACPFHSAFYTLSYASVTLSIVILVRLAIGTRKVPRNFNESFWLGACIYTICILIIFMIPISTVTTIDTSTKRIFSIIASFVVIESMLLFLFWTKFFKIKGWFKSNKFAFMRSNEQSSNTGHTRTRKKNEQSRTAVSAKSTTNNNNDNTGKKGEPSATSGYSAPRSKYLRNKNAKKAAETNKGKLSAEIDGNHTGTHQSLPSTTNTALND